MSFEIRFAVKLNGKIVGANENAKCLIDKFGDQFFDHFLEQDRGSAFHFIEQIGREQKQMEKILWQMKHQSPCAIKYRGIFYHDHIYLVGQWLDHLQEENQTFVKAREDIHFLAERIFSSLSIAIVRVDQDNQITFVNDVAYKYGLSTNVKANNNPYFEMMTEMANEIRQTNKDDQRFYYYGDSLHYVQGIHNEQNHSITFILDDRACSEEFNSLLRHKQQMESVSHLAAGFAHELRNPLSVIRGFIQLSYLTKDISKYYQTIISEMDRMNGIIDDFLSLSRKASKKHVHKPKELFNSLVPLIRSECLLRNIKLSYDFANTTKLVLLNESMIKQIVLNLLRNSIEAFGEEHPTEKSFKITGKVEEDHYVIYVEDNGPGMNEHVLKQLGKPFFTTKENGTGIGLPLCKKIIEDHDGEFIIESELGKGTTISFSFPFI